MAEHTLTLTGRAQTAEDLARQRALVCRGPIPAHIAIIMDGNGRWARERGYPRLHGHSAGVESVRDVTEASSQIGVGFLTLYTFSVENWGRPAREVNALMSLLLRTIRRERKTLEANNIRFRVIGDLSKLPNQAARELDETHESTSDKSGLTLVLALSYSGRWEIAEAARDLARQVRRGELDPEAIDEATVSSALLTRGLPDPDLLIRTGGEFRVSNFLLWQLAYTEILVTDCFWPAFRRNQLYAAVEAYQDRDRRFGRVDQ